MGAVEEEGEERVAVDQPLEAVQEPQEEEELVEEQQEVWWPLQPRQGQGQQGQALPRPRGREAE